MCVQNVVTCIAKFPYEKPLRPAERNCGHKKNCAQLPKLVHEADGALGWGFGHCTGSWWPFRASPNRPQLVQTRPKMHPCTLLHILSCHCSCMTICIFEEYFSNICTIFLCQSCTLVVKRMFVPFLCAICKSAQFVNLCNL